MMYNSQQLSDKSNSDTLISDDASYFDPPLLKTNQTRSGVTSDADIRSNLENESELNIGKVSSADKYMKKRNCTLEDVLLAKNVSTPTKVKSQSDSSGIIRSNSDRYDLIETHNISTHIIGERDITNGFALCRPQKDVIFPLSEGDKSDNLSRGGGIHHFDQSGGKRQLRESELDYYD